MKPQQRNSVDGFVPRRRPQAGANLVGQEVPARFLRSSAEEVSPLRSFELPGATGATGLVRPETIESAPEETTDVNDVLSTLSDDPFASAHPERQIIPRKVKKQRAKKEKGEKKRHPRRKKIIIWSIVGVLAAILAVAGFLFVKAYITSGKVFNGGNIVSLLTPGTPLKTDAQGRTNILVFGTSQDDTAHQDASGGGGLWLTDSIELVSIDQKNNTVKMVGIPRDLWVELEDECSVGDYSKINAVYECGSGLSSASDMKASDYKQKDKTGAESLMDTIATVTGVSPQYYIHVDYGVLKQAVDAVGGVDVKIEGDGSSGIYDTNFDWDCPNGAYTCKNVYYPKDGTYHINGTQALFLARARGDAGAYSYKDFGLARGDFDRQANQQKIMIALQKKATSASVLANPIALNNLLDAFGNNVTTNLSGGEIKSLLDFAKKLPNNNIKQVSLVESGKSVVTTGMISGQSVVIATSGELDYSSIIDYLTKQLSTNPAASENATIGVYNASSRIGAAASEQKKLEGLGFTVSEVGDADSSDAGSGSFTLYDQSGGKKPATLKALESSLGVSASSDTLPADILSDDDFVVIVNQ